VPENAKAILESLRKIHASAPYSKSLLASGILSNDIE